MLESIRLQHFRSHHEAEFAFSDKLTVITGYNGIGKTNILEAIYVVSRGTSFRGADAEILEHGEEWYKISTHYTDDSSRSVQYQADKPLQKKTFKIGADKKLRLSSTQKLPVVLFEPDDLRLIHGSPSRRRDFLDRILIGLVPAYASLLHKYERSLLQRNNLLKQARASDDELFVWEVQLAEHGSRVIEARLKLIDDINKRITGVYQSISHTTDSVSIGYSFHPAHGPLAQQLLSHLHVSRYTDRMRGFTSVGPHRHNLLLTLNDTSADESASRGETRSIILALKFIELELLNKALNKPPLLLLDDVFSELDRDRRHALIELSQTVQTIITTTDKPKGLHKSVKFIEL